jgi:hypothetical protein
MATLRKPRFYEWLFTGAVLALGAAILGLFLFDRHRGPVPEDQLTYVQGPAVNVVYEGGELNFTVSGYHMRFSVNNVRNYDQYDALAKVIWSGQSLRVGLTTRQEALIHHPELAVLYSLSADGKAVLSYEDHVSAHAKAARSAIYVGGFLFPLGCFGIWLNLRNHRRWAAAVAAANGGPLPEVPPIGREAFAKRFRVVWIALTVVMYAILIGVNFDDGADVRFAKAFGERPFGLPVILVVCLVETVWFLPMPWVFKHALQRSMQSGVAWQRFKGNYASDVGWTAEELRRSRWVCLGGVLYFLALCAFWIAHAPKR